MVGLLLVLAAPPARNLSTGLERRYRVSVVREGGDEFRYRLQTKVAPQKTATGKDLELTLTDYQGVVDGRKIHVGRLGGGLLPIAATGMPSGLNVTGPQGPMWLPLVAFYLPGITQEGPFDLPDVGLDGGLVLGGKGEYAEKKTRMVVLTATLSRSEKPLGTLAVATTIDDAGWPQKSEGTLVSADGTTRFTLAKG